MGLSYQYFATKIDNYRYPAPGKLIDVGGYKLHSYCLGTGQPTVILDSGLGGDASWWALVQKEISKFARVCSYDRAGYGWSDAGPKPRTSKIIIDELHSLLHSQDTLPPYILVGHSFGGINMRLYANIYPEDVFAVVLVDSSHEKQYERFKEHKKNLPQLKVSVPTHIKNYILNSRFSHYIGITRWFLPNSMKEFFSDSMPQKLRQIIIAKASSIKSLEARDNERQNIKESFRQVEKSINNMRNKPLIVISQGKKGEEGLGKIWLKCQQELASKSIKCKHIIAYKSGHMINVEQPKIIVQAVYKLVNEYNSNVKNV